MGTSMGSKACRECLSLKVFLAFLVPQLNEVDCHQTFLRTQNNLSVFLFLVLKRCPPRCR